MREALRLSKYRRLLTAYGLNELTWAVGTVALAVLVYRKTGSALGSTSFYLASQVFPALFSPLLVARLTHRPPGKALPILYGLEAVMFGVLAWLTTSFSLVPVLAVTVLDGTIAVGARAIARSATVDVLRPHDLLQEGNALTNTVFSVCFMAGPALGGLVVATGGTAAALLTNSGLFLAIAVTLASAAGGLGRGLEEDEGMSTRERLRAAIAYVGQNRPVRWLLLLQGVQMVVITVVIPVEVVLAQHTLHAGPAGYSALLSGWGGGAVIGSAAYARWRRSSQAVLVALSTVLMSIGFTIMASSPTIVVAVVGAVVGGCGNGFGSIAARTLLQQYTPQRWMTIVMSLNESISQAAPGVGILIGGVITVLSNPRVALAVGAVGSFGFAVAFALIVRPSRLPLPEDLAHDEPAATDEDGLPRLVDDRESLV